MPVLDFPSLHIDDSGAAELPSVAFGLLRGDDDAKLSDIAARDLVYRDFMYVFGVMLAPDDFKLQIRLNHALTAHEIFEAAKLIVEIGLPADVDLDVAISLGEREDHKELLGKLISNDSLHHVVSGFILRWIVSRWHNSSTRNEASLAKAASVVEEWAKQHQIAGAKKQNVIRNIWRKYSSVSHLWAALHLAQEGNVDITTPFGFSAFCGTAQWLLEQAAVIVPIGRRADEAVLPIDRAWTIPTPFVRRKPDGSVGTRYWNKAPEAHDIRNMRGGFPA